MSTTGSNAQNSRLATPPSIKLAIVIPTYNERENVGIVVDRLRQVLQGISWEAIFVDDDSPDGTADEIRKIGAHDRSIRLIHRIGRRGLSSASVEGMLSTCAESIAVMDADLQHDESILPIMLQHTQTGDVDLVVATRNAKGGSKGKFAKDRVILSDIGAKLSSLACKTRISDPMSGFFMLTQPLLIELVHRLSITGFKILVDLVATADRKLRVVEIPYEFRNREHGESKLDVSIGLEYIYLLVEKISRGTIPVRFVMFLFVGGVGVFVHLVTLSTCLFLLHTHFLLGQAIATWVAMTGNFFLNNAITFRDSRLHGWYILRGLCTFYLICSLGALTNITVAQYTFTHSWPWIFAAIAGAAVSSVWNFVVSSMFAWRRKAA